MRVGGGGSFLRVGGKRTENYEREGGRSRRLYLRSLRSMAANRLPFPLSFLLAFPPFSSSISKNQHYLLFVSPFAAFHLSPSPNRSIANFARFVFCGLHSLSLSLSRLNLSLPLFLRWRLVHRGTDSLRDIDVLERETLRSRYVSSLSRESEERRKCWTIRGIDWPRWFFVAGAENNGDKKQARLGNSCGRER